MARRVWSKEHSMSILGTPVAERGESARPARGREAERVLAAELLAAFRHMAQSTTDFMARIASGIINDVLVVETATFPADGIVHRQYGVAAGVIEVRNLAATNVVTVSSSGPSSAAPSGGVGVYKVPGGVESEIHLASHQVTFYGTSGDSVSFQVLTSGGSDR
jgi:hypothetical protein